MKMEMHGGNGRSGRGGKGFDIGNIVGDPFSLATIGIAICGWLIAFVSSIIADVSEQYPNFAWWTLVYTFFCIIGVFITVATDSIFTYHVAIVGFLAAGLVFTTSSVNSLIYSSDPSKEAAAAGFILLSMVAIVWIFYYGSQPQASHRQTIDSFALHKDHPQSRTSRHMTQSFRPDTTVSTNAPQQMYNSAQLAGFETSSPVTGFPSGRAGEFKRESGPAFPVPAQQTQQSPVPHQSFPPPLQQQQQQHLSQHQYQPQQQQQQQPQSQPQQVMPTLAPPQPDSSVSQPIEYPYRAKAIYSYEANPDDANEISFAKHEILEVSDVSGRWWQAKKENGETGIAPSNYLILL